MAPRTPKMKHDTDGTPRPEGIVNPGHGHDQVQGGDPGNTGVFEWEYVVLPQKGVTVVDPDQLTANGEIATETAALDHGYRPTGPSELVGVEDHHDGVSKIVRWKVPVVPNTAQSLLEDGALAEPHKLLPPVRGVDGDVDKSVQAHNEAVPGPATLARQDDDKSQG